MYISIVTGLRVRSTESEEAAEEQASERSGAESAQSRCSLVLVTRAEYEGAVYPYRILTLRLACGKMTWNILRACSEEILEKHWIIKGARAFLIN